MRISPVAHTPTPAPVRFTQDITEQHTGKCPRPPRTHPPKPLYFTSMTQSPDSDGSSSAETATSYHSPATGSEPTPPNSQPTGPSAPTKTAHSASSPTPVPQPAEFTILVPVLDIDLPVQANGRCEIDEEKVAWLADAIQTQGLLHPITLQKNGKRWNLIAGCHRLKAHILLQRHFIQSVILDVSNHTANVLRLSENVARSELTPVEEALQLAAIMSQEGMDVDRLANELGRSPNWILDRLDMAAWDPDLLQHVHDRRITISAATHLSKIEPPWQQQELVRHAATGGLSATAAKQWLDQTRIPSYQEAHPEPNQASDSLQEFTTVVSVTCFCCKHKVPIDHAKPAHVCDACMQDIATAAAQPTPPK